MQRGVVALVKSYPNDPIIRFVVEEMGDEVKLCMEDEFKLWQAEGIAPLTVRCPMVRVFRYDHDLIKKLKEAAYTQRDNELLEDLWKQARNWTDGSK